MSDLCQTCGIRLTEGLCQCPEVLIAEVERLHRDLANERRELGVYQEIIDEQRDTLRAQRKQVRSLRAKLMRERADAQVCIADLAKVIDGLTRSRMKNPIVAGFHARARRLRAKAERVERGEA